VGDQTKLAVSKIYYPNAIECAHVSESTKSHGMICLQCALGGVKSDDGWLHA